MRERERGNRLRRRGGVGEKKETAGEKRERRRVEGLLTSKAERTILI